MCDIRWEFCVCTRIIALRVSLDNKKQGRKKEKKNELVVRNLDKSETPTETDNMLCTETSIIRDCFHLPPSESDDTTHKRHFTRRIHIYICSCSPVCCTRSSWRCRCDTQHATQNNRLRGRFGLRWKKKTIFIVPAFGLPTADGRMSVRAGCFMKED